MCGDAQPGVHLTLGLTTTESRRLGAGLLNGFGDVVVADAGVPTRELGAQLHADLAGHDPLDKRPRRLWTGRTSHPSRHISYRDGRAHFGPPWDTRNPCCRRRTATDRTCACLLASDQREERSTA